MASESRQLPKSHQARIVSLEWAVRKNIATSGSILKASIQTRLNSITPIFRIRFDARAPLKQNLAKLTSQKLIYYNKLVLVCSHFIQMLNFEIAEENLSSTVRDWYKLPISSGQLPKMMSEDNLSRVASDLIKGEADRTAAGGTPLLYPIARVQAAFINFDSIRMPHSTATDALDTAQEALDALVREADRVIKKVWDEVETYYNEEAPKSQRENARGWGVVYVLRGSKKTLEGKVIDAATNLPVAGAKVYFKGGNNKAITDKDGSFLLKTTMMNTQDLRAEKEKYRNYSVPKTLIEYRNIEGLEIKMTPA